MARRGWVLPLAGFLFLGCGDDSSTDSVGTGGDASVGGGTAASGGAATGGAAGGFSTALRGAISLNVLGSGCSLGDQYLDFPPVATGHPVSATEVLELATDEMTMPDGQRVNIACTWRDGSVEVAIQIGVGVKSVSFGSTTVVGETELGGLAVTDPALPEPYGSSSEDPCVYSAIEVDEATHTIWGQVSCGIFENQLATDRCALGASYFYVENCPDA